MIQGNAAFTGYGTSIKKSNYSENPNSAKLFTYTETIEAEANIKETLAKVVGKLGINTGDLTKGGIMPLLTGMPIGIGTILPHTHRMLFKHVHRTEPVYLYRVPNIFKVFTKSMGSFNDFLKILGS